MDWLRWLQLQPAVPESKEHCRPQREHQRALARHFARSEAQSDVDVPGRPPCLAAGDRRGADANRSSQSAQHESRAADRPLTVPRRLVDGSSAGCYSAFSRPRRGLDGATGFGLDGLPPGAGEACVWLGGGDEAAAGARERTGPVCAGGDAAGAEPPCMLPT